MQFMKNSESIYVRCGRESDINSVFKLIEEQAIHHQVDIEAISNTPEQMRKDAFGSRKYLDFFVAEEAGQIIGAAVFYFTYSTWKGKSLYLEDLIITQSHRGRGVGQLFMQALAEEAVEKGAQKMKWQVAEDNHGAIRFYERSDADLDPNWINCELSHEQLADMAEETVLN